MQSSLKWLAYRLLLTIQFRILGYVRGYGKIWIVGDEFCFNTVQQYYKNPKNDDGTLKMFAYQFFEVRELTASKYASNTRGFLPRLINLIVKNLNEHSALPKLIVMVLDDDLIRGTRPNTKTDMITFLTRITVYLVNQLERIIAAYKGVLPDKAKRDNKK